MDYRLWVYKLIYHLFQYPSKVVTETADARINIGVTENDDKEILVAITDDNMVAKEFQKHEHYRKNHTRNQVNQVIPNETHQWKISQQAWVQTETLLRKELFLKVVIFPLCNMAIIGKTEVVRGFWNQVNWKNDNPLLFVTVEQNRPIIIISLASLESQSVPNFVDETII